MSKLVKGLTLAALVSITPVALAGSHAEVNVVSWGGAYAESQKKGYLDPYQEKSGVTVNLLDYSGGLGAIRSQVEAGAIT